MGGVLTPETHWRNENCSESSLMRQTRVTRTLGTYITSHHSTAQHTQTQKKTQKDTKNYTKGHKKLHKRTQKLHKRTQRITQKDTKITHKDTKAMYARGCSLRGEVRSSLWCDLLCGIGACRMLNTTKLSVLCIGEICMCV